MSTPQVPTPEEWEEVESMIEAAEAPLADALSERFGIPVPPTMGEMP